jgi:FHS family L-fucose permease-like MFS transporter
MTGPMNKISNLFRTADGKNHAAIFVLVSSLFFLWGLCNGMIDVLNKHFQNSLHVSMAASAFVQFANFMGYFFMAIPSGLVAKRFGYKGGILLGLVLIAAGALWFIPATHIGTFWAFLAGLFVLATGLAVLETIANPYTTVMGPVESGAARINMAQTCNALGTFLGPILAGFFILSSTGQANRSNGSLFLPYLVVAGLVMVLIFLFWKTELPDLAADEESPVVLTDGHVSTRPLWHRWHFMLAVGAQFFYVAAQVGVWSYFINYVRSGDMPALPPWMVHMMSSSWTSNTAGLWHLTDFGGSIAFSGGILCFLAGRIVGSAILSVCSAHRTLAVFGVLDSIMMILIILHLGWISVAALFLSCFFMSIMYPTIFALGIRGLGEHTKLGSSIIVMAIVGGAVMPFLMGWLADTYSMRMGFLMPLGCFIYVAAYAALWPWLERLDTSGSAGHRRAGMAVTPSSN